MRVLDCCCYVPVDPVAPLLSSPLFESQDLPVAGKDSSTPWKSMEIPLVI